MTTKGEWNKFTGSQTEIEEINNSKRYQLKRKDGMESYILEPPLSIDNQVWEMELECTEFYRIFE